MSKSPKVSVEIEAAALIAATLMLPAKKRTPGAVVDLAREVRGAWLAPPPAGKRVKIVTPLQELAAQRGKGQGN